MSLNDTFTKCSADQSIQHYLDSVAVGVHWLNKDGFISWVNNAGLNLLGYEKGEFIGHHMSKFCCDAGVVRRILEKTEKKEIVHNFEVSLKHKDGTVKKVLLSSSVLSADDLSYRTSWFTVDITEQRSAEEERFSRELLYREVLESLPAAVYTCDANGRIDMFNKAAAVLWGRQPAIGKDLWCGSWKIYNVDNGTPLPLEECPMALTLKTGKPTHGKIIVVERPDKSRRIVAPHPNPIYDQKGNLAGATNMLIDITDQWHASDILRASEERFKLICQLVPTAIWMADDSGEVTYLNGRWTELTGHQVERSYGSSWIEFVHPDDRVQTQRVIDNAMTTKEPFVVKFRHLTSGGDYHTMRSTGSPHLDQHGNVIAFIGIVQDIDLEEKARKHLEDQITERTSELAYINQELKMSEGRFHRMIDEVQDYAIIYLNRQGIIENWNLGAEKIKGYRGGEIIGHHFRVFYPQRDQDSGLPEIFLQQAAQLGRALYEGWRVRKDGSRFWGSVVLTALHNEVGAVIGFSKVTRDLTERKLAHDALVEQNKKLEKMNQELLTFAYVSSHDLQEPLRKIQSFSSLILDVDGSKLTTKGREYFKIVLASASRMRMLIDDILAYALTGSDDGKFVPTDLNSVLDEILQELRPQIEEKNAQIEISRLPILEVVPFQFRQLLWNIIANALKFSKNNVHPHIVLTYEVVDAIELSSSGPYETYHRISIADNGIGFDPLYKSKIFEVFQRLHTKSEFVGTGIGLAICRKIAENHHGAITAEGSVGAGSTFHIFIPNSGAAARQPYDGSSHLLSQLVTTDK